MAEEEAKFTEVIEVSLDLTEAKQQLEEFGKLYQAALSGASGGGNNDAFNLSGSIAAFKNTLSELQTNLTSFATNIQDSIDRAVSATTKAAETGATSAVDQLKELRAQAQLAKKEADAAAASTPKNYQSLSKQTSEIKAALDRGDKNQPSINFNAFNGRELYDHIQDRLKEYNERGIPEDYMKNLSAGNQAAYLSQAANYAQLENKANYLDPAKKSAQDESELNKGVDAEQKAAALKQRQMDAMYAQLEQEKSKERALDEKSAVDEINQGNRLAQERERQMEQMFAAKDRSTKQEAASVQSATNAEVRANEQVQKSASESTQSQLAALDKVAQAQRKAAADKERAVQQEQRYYDTLNSRMDRMTSLTSAAESRKLSTQRLADKPNANDAVQGAAKNVEDGVVRMRAALEAAKVAAEDLRKSMGAISVEERAAAEEALRMQEAVIEASAREVAAARQVALSNTENLSFFDKFTSEIGSSIANVVKFQLLWGGVGAAINGAMALIASPFKTLESGVEYLSQMQEKVDELTGVISQNVVYSKDFIDNLKQSRVAAEGVVETFRQMAATDHIPFDNLVRAFDALQSNGVAKLTNNMKEATGVAEVFALAIQASGKSAESVRSLIGQIPKLLAGQVTGMEPILNVLGLTKQQWEGILADATQHRNLLDSIKDKSDALVAANKEAADSQGRVTEELKVFVSEAEGFFAKDVWAKMGEDLIKVRDYLAQHKQLIVDIAGELGSAMLTALSAVEKAVVSVFNIGGDGKIPPLLQVVVKTAAEIQRVATSFSHLGDIISDYHDSYTRTMGTVGAVMHFPGMENYDMPAQPESKEQRDARFKADYAKIDSDETTLLSGKSTSSTLNTMLGGSVQSLIDQLNKAYDGTHNPPERDAKAKQPTDDERLARESRDQKLADAQAQREAAENAAKQQFADRKINEQQLHDLTMAALSEEFVKVQQIVNEYKQVISGLRDDHGQPLDNKKFTELNSDAERQRTTRDTALSNQAAEADRALAQANEARRKQQYEADLAAFKANEEKKIEIAKLSGASQTEIARQELAAKMGAYQLEQDELRKQIAQSATGSNEQAQFQNRLSLSQSNQASDTQIGNAKIVDAGFEDQLDSARAQYESQYKAVQDVYDKAEESMGKNPSAQQKDNLAELAVNVTDVAESYLDFLQKLAVKAKAMGASSQEVNKILKDASSQSGTVVTDSRKESANINAAQTGNGANLVQLLFGGDAQNWSDFGHVQTTDASGNTASTFSFTKTVNDLNSAFKELSTNALMIAKAFADSNALAGAGAISSSVGTVATAASNLQGIKGTTLGNVLGEAGGIASIAGSIIGTISSILEAEAQHIAQVIQKAFQETMIAYQTGTATLTGTLQQVEAQRTQAIAELSGKKGGQSQLNQLLPTLDQSIATMQQQQAETIESFENTVAGLNMSAGLNNSPLANMLTTWQQINDQVQQYISAGGNAQTAAEALSLTLKQISTDAWTNLNQGEQTAIQDALNLNQLLQQRINLENEYTQQVNQLLGQDSLKRTASLGVSTGMQIQELQANYNLQMTQLNAQISLGQQQVDMYQQIYDIQTSTVALEAQSNAANLAALQQQITMLKQYAEIYSNIYQNPTTGAYQMNSGFQQSIGAVNINVNDSNLTQQQLTDAITQALENSARNGTGLSYTTFNNP